MFTPKPQLWVAGQYQPYQIQRMVLSHMVSDDQVCQLTFCMQAVPSCLYSTCPISVYWQEDKQDRVWHGVVTRLALSDTQLNLTAHSPLWWLTQWRHIQWYAKQTKGEAISHLVKRVQMQDSRVRLVCHVEATVLGAVVTQAKNDWQYWQYLTQTEGFILIHHPKQVICQVGKFASSAGYCLTLWQSGRRWQWHKTPLVSSKNQVTCMPLPGFMSGAVCHAQPQQRQSDGQLYVKFPPWLTQQQAHMTIFALCDQQGVVSQKVTAFHGSSETAKGIVVTQNGSAKAMQWLGGLPSLCQPSHHIRQAQTHAIWKNHYGTQLWMQARGWQYAHALWQAQAQSQGHVSRWILGKDGSEDNTSHIMRLSVGRSYQLNVGQVYQCQFDSGKAGTWYEHLDVNMCQYTYGFQEERHERYQHGRSEQQCRLPSCYRIQTKKYQQHQCGPYRCVIQHATLLRLNGQALQVQQKIEQYHQVYQQRYRQERQAPKQYETLLGTITIQARYFEGQFVVCHWQMANYHVVSQDSAAFLQHAAQSGQCYQHVASTLHFSTQQITVVAKSINIS